MAVAVALNWAVLLSTLSADAETGSKDRQRHEALPNSTILGGRHWRIKMEIKPDRKGDASNSAFTSADKMRFCSLTYEVIEELKLRRELAAENEKKIEKLINDRFTMGWKLDKECGKVANLSERHETELRETRRQLEERMRDCQAEASQQQVYRKMAEKEKEALKDEIRRLQLANYSLEKRVRESERQDKIQANEREQHIRQVSRFEALCTQFDGMVKQMTSTQEKLDRDMKAVQNLNKSLQYQNSHQKCVLDMKEADLVKLRQQLLDTQIKVKVDPDRIQEREEELHGEIRRLRNLVTKLEENNTSLDKDKDSWKEKYWDSLKKLEESHRLINVHLHNAARYRDECNSAEKLQRETQVKLEETEHDLQEIKVEMENSQQKYKEDREALTADTAQLNSEIEVLKSEIQNLSSEKEEVEKSLSNAEETVADIKKQLEDALIIINVEKFHIECQTHLQMLQMLSTEVQAKPDLQNQVSQILVDTCTGVTQTIDPALCSTEVQTDFQGSETTEIQTDTFDTKTAEVQTEYELNNVGNFKHAMTQTGLNTLEKETDSREDLGKETYKNSKRYEQDKDITQIGEEVTEGLQEMDTFIECLKQNIEKESISNTDRHTDHSNNNAIETIELDEISGKRFGQDAPNNETVKLKKDIQSMTEISEADVRESVIYKEPYDNFDSEDAVKVEFSSENKLHTRRFKLKNTNSKEDSPVKIVKVMTDISDKITGKEREDSVIITQSYIEVAEVQNMKEREVKNAGLIIPKIDIEKSIECARIVPVYPEEFSIKLTQDEMTDKVYLERASQDTPSFNKSNHGYLNSRSKTDYECSQTRKDEVEPPNESYEIDKAIQQNWEMSEQPGRINKPRAKKHKLSKETVTDQFSSFDMTQEKFQRSHCKDKVQPKHPKLREMSGCKKSGLPKKQRQYSSMFQVGVTETVDENGDKVKLAKYTGQQRSFQEDVNYIVTKEETQNQSSDINSQKKCQLSSERKRKCNNQQTKPILNKSCMVQSAEEIAGMWPCSTSDNSMNSTISSPVSIAKPLLNNAKLNNPTDSKSLSTTLRQENSPTAKQKEQILVDKFCSDKDSSETVGNVSAPKAAVLLENSASDGNAVCDDIGSVVVNTPDIAISAPVFVSTAAGAPKFQKPVLDGVNVMETINSSLKKVCRASSTSSAHLSSTSAQDTVDTSTVSDLRRTKTESNTDFLQKYMDIVAKIKLPQHSALPQTNITQKTTGITNLSPRNSSIPDFSRRVSPRGITPASILKGASRRDRKTRNVTWNEYVLHKAFVRDENTPEEK